mgnify:CR=1 FL=1
MDRTYYVGNRRRFYDMMETESLAAIFAGEELWKTGDEYYPFFADRNFVYLTGLKSGERTSFGTALSAAAGCTGGALDGSSRETA